ncbi:MAG: hypothetical protein SF052_07230 [Bacteroidia bacterium]|nr:hypothetical protein [Bacteroidia bacterium]
MLFKKACLLFALLLSIGLATTVFCQPSPEGIHLALTPYAEMYQEKANNTPKKEKPVMQPSPTNNSSVNCKAHSEKCSCNPPEKPAGTEKKQK